VARWHRSPQTSKQLYAYCQPCGSGVLERRRAWHTAFQQDRIVIGILGEQPDRTPAVIEPQSRGFADRLAMADRDFENAGCTVP
jgi:hypothetical protein